MADYRKVVLRSVRRAFRQVGTLAKNVVFNSSQSTGFNFANSSTIDGAVTALPIKVVVTDTKKKPGEESMNTRSKTLIMIAEDAPNLSPYDTVTIDGDVWKITLPIKNDGYVINVDVTREG